MEVRCSPDHLLRKLDFGAVVPASGATLWLPSAFAVYFWVYGCTPDAFAFVLHVAGCSRAVGCFLAWTSEEVLAALGHLLVTLPIEMDRPVRAVLARAPAAADDDVSMMSCVMVRALIARELADGLPELAFAEITARDVHLAVCSACHDSESIAGIGAFVAARGARRPPRVSGKRARVQAGGSIVAPFDDDPTGNRGST